MSNPFDQFDAAKTAALKNPFDQFDTPEPADRITQADAYNAELNTRMKISKPSEDTPTDRGFLGAAGDIGLSVAAGAANLGGAVTQAADMASRLNPMILVGDAISEKIGIPTSADAFDAGRRVAGDAESYLRDQKSDYSKGRAQEVESADGFWDTAAAYLHNPSQIAEGIAGSLPYMVPVGAAARIAKGVQMGAKGITGVTAGTGAVLEGGAAGVQANSEVMDMTAGELLELSPDYAELIAQEVDPEKAKSIVASRAGFTAQALQMPISFLASKLSGAAKLESEFFTGNQARGLLKTLPMMMGREGIEEIIQEGANQASVNTGVKLFGDENREVMDNVADAAASGMMIGVGQAAGMKGTGWAVNKVFGDPAPVNPNEDGAIDLPANGEQLGGVTQEQAADVPQLTHNPERMVVMPDGTTAWESELPALAEQVAATRHPAFPREAEQFQADEELPAQLTHNPQRMVSLADGSVAWESDLPAIQQESISAQHPAYARITETPDQVEASLAEPIAIDDEINSMMMDLDNYRAERVRQTVQPAMQKVMSAPVQNGVNPFDRFDEAPAVGLFDGVRDMQAAEANAAREQEAKRVELMNANFQENEDGGLFAGVKALAEQARYEPVKNEVDNAVVAELYPADNARPFPIEQVPAQEFPDALPVEPAQSLPDVPAEPAPTVAEQIDAAASEAALSPLNDLPEPTEAMKEAGNYKKAHVKIKGLDIAIENPRGSNRSGTDSKGNKWEVKMHSHYGYIKRTEGADGDHVDVFIGPSTESQKVFIVDQINPDGSFDEHKVLMGFDSKLKARSGYKSNYSHGWKVGPITSMTMDEFKDWVKNGDTKKPLSSALPVNASTESAASLVEQKPAKPELKPPISESKQPKTESDAPVREQVVEQSDLPPILTQTKKQFIAGMAKERGLKKDSPGYPAALAKLESEYVESVDRAQAELSFEKFNELNSDSPESVNRQAYDALRQDFGIDGDALYSLRDKRESKESIARETAQAIIDRISKDWKVDAKVKLVDSMSDLPADVRQRLNEDGKSLNDVQAMYHPKTGNIYLNSASLEDAAHVERLVFHEVYAHMGLQNLFGSNVTGVMARLYLAIGGQGGINRIASERGIDLSNYQALYSDAPVDYRNAVIAEELLAHLAENPKPKVQQLWAELIGAIKAWLRKNGFADLSKVSDSDIAYLLKQARETVTKGKNGDTAGLIYALAGMNQAERKAMNAERDLVKYSLDGKGAPSRGQLKLKAGKNKKGSPVFFNDELKMLGLKKLAIPDSEFSPYNELPMGHLEHVEDGSEVWSMAAGIDGKKVADLTVEIKGGEITAIHDISVVRSQRGTGIGEKIVASLLATTSNPVRIIEAAPSAKAFWSKMGANGFFDLHDNTTIGWADYARNRARRSEQERDGKPAGDGKQSGIRQTIQRDRPDDSGRSDPMGSDREYTDDEKQFFRDNDIRYSLGQQTRPSGGFSVSGSQSGRDEIIQAGFNSLGGLNSWKQKAKLKIKELIAPMGNLPEFAKQLKVDRDGKLNADDAEMTYALRDFYDKVESVYHKKYDDLKPATRREINDYLKGDRTKVQLTAQTVAMLDTLRNSIKKMSGRLAESYMRDIDTLQEEMKSASNTEKARIAANIETLSARVDTIVNNLDTYLHRSYRAFDDPKWPKKIKSDHRDVYEKAVDFIAKRLAGDNAVEDSHIRDATKKVDLILHEGTAYGNIVSFIAEGKLGSKDLGITKQKKAVPAEIRALLGEYEDPAINYAKSVAKMSRLIHNSEFLQRFRNEGIASGILFNEDNRELGATAKVAGENSEVYSPLNGLYTYPEVLKALTDATGTNQEPDIIKNIILVSGMIKYGKTVLSPTTAARNIISASQFTLGNGHFNLTHADKAVRALKTYFTKKDYEGSREYIKKMLELGVLYDSPNFRELQDVINRLDDVDFKGAKYVKWMKEKVLDNAQNFYAIGDDFWKVIGFENEKSMLMEYHGMDEKTAGKEAAKRIRNTYPTYSFVGRGVRNLGRWPIVAAFPSFTSEVIRTSYHRLNYIREDRKKLGITNPYVLKKITGFALQWSLNSALVAVGVAMYGIGDEEDEAIRDGLWDNQKNSALLYTGRDEKGNPTYYDIGWLDPYSYFKKPIKALARDEPIEAINEFHKPFTDPDILPSSIWKYIENIQNSNKTAFEANKTLFLNLAPGFVTNTHNIIQAIRGQTEDNGRVYTAKDEMLALIGFRRSTLNPKVALTSKGYGYKEEKTAAGAVFRKKAKSLSDVSEEELRKRYSDMIEDQRKAWDKMRRSVAMAMRSGLSKDAAIASLRESGISAADARDLVNEKEFRFVPPYQMTKKLSRKISFEQEIEIRQMQQKRIKFLHDLYREK